MLLRLIVLLQLPEVDEIHDILYVGRLVEEKKVKLLLEGYIYARKHGLIPSQAKLVFVGSWSRTCAI